MKKIFMVIICIFALGNLTNVKATPGYLKQSSIKTCNGVLYGSHGDGHWHVATKNEDGRYNAVGNPIYIDPCNNNTTTNNGSNNNTTTNNDSNNSATNNNISNNDNQVKEPIIIKSTDNTIKSIKVNNDNIDVNDNMKYSTIKTIATIEIILNNENAKAEYKTENDLTIGNNSIEINVKAEDGSIKKYNLNITREKELSTNKKIKIMVNNKEIKFTEYKNEDIMISSSEEKVNITYELEEKNAKVEVKGNENLKVGKNNIIITVISENGESQDYTLIVKKSNKTEDIIAGIITLIFLGGIGFGIFCLLKKIIKR